MTEMTNEVLEGWSTLDDADHEFSVDPEYRAARVAADQRGERRRAAYGVALSHLRRARALSQITLARDLGVAQAEISRIEHQTDLLASTLTSYIEAMGGELTLFVRFPDQEPVELEIDAITEALSSTS
jgi:ribosome-binding protein aMBF1 (putative translation factor)